MLTAYLKTLVVSAALPPARVRLFTASTGFLASRPMRHPEKYPEYGIFPVACLPMFVP